MAVSNWNNVASHPALILKFKNGQDVDLCEEENNVERKAWQQGGRSSLFAFNPLTGECRDEGQIYPWRIEVDFINDLGMDSVRFEWPEKEPRIAALLPGEILIRQTVTVYPTTVHNFWDALTM